VNRFPKGFRMSSWLSLKLTIITRMCLENVNFEGRRRIAL
jgi:hypothetical protein